MFDINCPSKDHRCPRTREFWTNLFCQVITHEDNPIDLFWEKSIDNRNFFIIVFIAVGKDDVVLVHFSNVINPLCQSREITIGNIWNHNTYRCGFLTRKSTSYCIRTIVQTFNDFQYFFTSIFLNVLISVHDTANSRHWDPRLSGNVVNGYSIVCIHITSFLYWKFRFQSSITTILSLIVNTFKHFNIFLQTLDFLGKIWQNIINRKKVAYV